MQTVKSRPYLVGWLLLYLVVSFGALWAVLAAVGKLSAFGDLGAIPAVLSGSLFAARLERARR